MTREDQNERVIKNESTMSVIILLVFLEELSTSFSNLEIKAKSLF